MPSKDVQQFVSLRDALVNEKAILEARLAEIDGALGGTSAPAPVARAKRRGRPPGRKKAARKASAPTAAKKAAKKKGAGKAGRKPRGGISLPDAVLKVTANKPLKVKDIIAAVQKIGYKYATNNPTNSTRTMLYTNKKFKNHGGGIFGPA